MEKVLTPKAWSYSSAKLFETCPRKYEAEKITKEVRFTDTEATLYGKELHLAAEEFIKNGKPLDPRFGWMLPTLDKLNNLPGKKHCELKLGVKKEDGRLVACDFFDSAVWFRGIADLIILDGVKGFVIDYKTSKSSKYADPRQLALMAAAMFLKYPELERVKAGLLFVVAGDFIKTEYKREDCLSIFAELSDLLTQREMAYSTGVFNAKPNGLCSRWCEVLSCEHNGRR
jgi:CRISPR/Cas system-associated exonuclease Cas4 (RecB family)